MPNKLLDTKILTYLNPRLTRPLHDIESEELTGWTSGGAIRDSVGVKQIEGFISSGRNGASRNSSLGINDWYSPLLIWGGGDVMSLISVSFHFDKNDESGISLVAGNNSEGALKQAYIAKTDWVKTYLENQKTTTQDIENLFS